MLHLMDEAQAIEKFSLAKRTYSYRHEEDRRVSPGRHFVVCSGDLSLPRDLDLDPGYWKGRHVLLSLSDDLPADVFAKTLGLIVDGNLAVNGAVVNAQSSSGVMLLVTGNLKARHLVGGGSEIRILGNVNIDEVLWAHDNDGVMIIGGDVTAPVVLNDDHDFEVHGRLAAEWTAGLHDSNEMDEEGADDEDAKEDEGFPGSLRQLLRPDILDREQFDLDLINGESVLLRNVGQITATSRDEWLAIVKAKGRQLLAVPAAYVDDALCRTAIESDPRAISCVPAEHLSPELCLLAESKDPAVLTRIPMEKRSRALCVQVVGGPCEFADIPLDVWDDDLLKRFLLHDGRRIRDVVTGLGEARMTPELIAAAIVGEGFGQVPQRFWHDEEIACLVLDYGIQVLNTIPFPLMSAPVHAKAKARFGQSPEWEEIERQHRPPETLTLKNFAKVWAVFLTEDTWLSLLALKPRRPILQMVHPALRSSRLVTAILHYDLANFPWVPYELMTEALCLQAVKHSPALLDAVPPSLRTKAVLRAARMHDGS